MKILIFLLVAATAQAQDTFTHGVVSHFATEVTQATTGTIEGFNLLEDGTEFVLIQPNEHINFQLIRSMIQLVVITHDHITVMQSWTKEENTYYSIIKLGSRPINLVYYPEHHYIVISNNPKQSI